MTDLLLHYGTQVPLGISSEDAHKVETRHFVNRKNRRGHVKMSKQERNELNRCIRRFPNKNHTPVGFNV